MIRDEMKSDIGRYDIYVRLASVCKQYHQVMRNQRFRQIIKRNLKGLSSITDLTLVETSSLILLLFPYIAINIALFSVINVKNFHGSLATVVRAQNDTSKTANITFLILHVEHYTRPYQQSHAKWRVKSYSHIKICSHCLIICTKQTDCFHANGLLSFTLYYANKQHFSESGRVALAVAYYTVFL